MVIVNDLDSVGSDKPHEILDWVGNQNGHQDPPFFIQNPYNTAGQAVASVWWKQDHNVLCLIEASLHNGDSGLFLVRFYAI
jgi:hypothetical protein